MDNLKPFICGERYNSNPPIEWEEVSMDDILELKRVALMTETFDSLRESNTFSQYVRNNPCINVYYKTTKKSIDCFFALKVGYLIDGVPSIAIYRVKEAYEKAGGVCNKITKYMGDKILEQFFTFGYFKNGITLEQLIRLICCRDYRPLEKSGDYMHGRDFDEVLLDKEILTVPKGFIERYPTNKWFRKSDKTVWVSEAESLKGALSRVH